MKFVLLYKLDFPFNEFSIDSLIEKLFSLIKDFRYLVKYPPLKSLSFRSLILISLNVLFTKS